MSLARITANIDGLGERRRRMYATVVMSVLMYGAPIWAQTVADDRRILTDVRKLRQLALRMIRGYRTVSHEAAAVLSGIVPFDLAADRLRSYLKRREIIARDDVIVPNVSAMLIEVQRRKAISKWSERLAELPPSGPGSMVRRALVDHLDEWIGRTHGALTYRITQGISNMPLLPGYNGYCGAYPSVLSILGRAEGGATAYNWGE
ncbi:PREDICTED: uncharacterized protein LOC108757451 [Trachymyrmex cornetzi]|uniref:uncharacterized protein LOC108757451 n=1 Tax=Trachymyrmex cornetzi TaxID=471704 RepID=UPI00084F2AFD|nr:PREDICTED: uncharacterized protein LOC108757451 [Trachymyrmex cornetzi]